MYLYRINIGVIVWVTVHASARVFVLIPVIVTRISTKKRSSKI